MVASGWKRAIGKTTYERGTTGAIGRRQRGWRYAVDRLLNDIGVQMYAESAVGHRKVMIEPLAQVTHDFEAHARVADLRGLSEFLHFHRKCPVLGDVGFHVGIAGLVHHGFFGRKMLLRIRTEAEQ